MRRSIRSSAERNTSAGDDRDPWLPWEHRRSSADVASRDRMHISIESTGGIGTRTPFASRSRLVYGGPRAGFERVFRSEKEHEGQLLVVAGGRSRYGRWMTAVREATPRPVTSHRPRGERKGNVRILVPKAGLPAQIEKGEELFLKVSRSILRAPTIEEALAKLEELRPSAAVLLHPLMAFLTRHHPSAVKSELDFQGSRTLALAKSEAPSLDAASRMSWDHVHQIDAAAREMSFSWLTEHMEKGAPLPSPSPELVASADHCGVLAVACTAGMMGLVRPRNKVLFSALLEEFHRANYARFLLIAVWSGNGSHRPPPLVIHEFTCRGRRFRLRGDFSIDVAQDGDYWLASHEPLGISCPGRSAREALTEFTEEFAATWDAMAVPESRLTLDARKLKRDLVARVARVEKK